MKNLLLAALLCATAVPAFAAPGDPAPSVAAVTGGTGSLALTTNVLRTMEHAGITLAWASLPGAAGVMPVHSGVLSLHCGHGELSMTGAMLLSNGPRTLLLRDWQYENIEARPFVTAIIVADGIPLGRVPVVNVQREATDTCANESGSGRDRLKFGTNQVPTLLFIDPQFGAYVGRFFAIDSTVQLFSTLEAIGSLNYSLTLAVDTAISPTHQ